MEIKFKDTYKDIEAKNTLKLLKEETGFSINKILCLAIKHYYSSRAYQFDKEFYKHGI
tara:strand:- start:1102 stop:1275 length:174 start_codon:yes stop_codon:yes gene_type:complete